MNYKDSGNKILGLVGGKDNVLNLTHRVYGSRGHCLSTDPCA